MAYPLNPISAPVDAAVISVAEVNEMGNKKNQRTSVISLEPAKEQEDDSGHSDRPKESDASRFDEEVRQHWNNIMESRKPSTPISALTWQETTKKVTQANGESSWS